MLYTRTSNRSLDEIEQGLQASAAAHKFGILGMHNLPEIMKKKGVEMGGECRVYEVCNPHQAKKVLETNPAISTALPCRISVYGTAGNYHVATILPSAMLGMFQSPELDSVAAEIDTVLKAMVDEAA